MDKKTAKRIMDAAYRALVKNPSASNYVLLQRAMLIYQDLDKNHGDR
jgi:hypothetical protein